jgi:hypothetical protein
MPTDINCEYLEACPTEVFPCLPQPMLNPRLAPTR